MFRFMTRRREDAAIIAGLRENAEGYAYSLFDLRSKVAGAERELAQVREALPVQPEVSRLIDELDRRLQRTGGAAFLTREEIDLLRKANPPSSQTTLE